MCVVNWRWPILRSSGMKMWCPSLLKIIHLPQFNRSKVHVLYALSLAYCGEEAKAEKEFKQMNGQFAHYEARYHYGIFLEKAERKEEAIQQFNQILQEYTHLSAREKAGYKEWFQQSREASQEIDCLTTSRAFFLVS